jgi:hypothetical protein
MGIKKVTLKFNFQLKILYPKNKEIYIIYIICNPLHLEKGHLGKLEKLFIKLQE